MCICASSVNDEEKNSPKTNKNKTQINHTKKKVLSLQLYFINVCIISSYSGSIICWFLNFLQPVCLIISITLGQCKYIMKVIVYILNMHLIYRLQVIYYLCQV